LNEVVNFCQQELLNLPFVKRKILFYSPSLYDPLKHIDFSCTLLKFSNVGNPRLRTQHRAKTKFHYKLAHKQEVSLAP